MSAISSNNSTNPSAIAASSDPSRPPANPEVQNIAANVDRVAAAAVQGYNTPPQTPAVTNPEDPVAPQQAITRPSRRHLNFNNIVSPRPLELPLVLDGTQNPIVSIHYSMPSPGAENGTHRGN